MQLKERIAARAFAAMFRVVPGGARRWTKFSNVTFCGTL
jgi:hypothetical protein